MGIIYDVAKIRIVPIDDLRPNSWNPKLTETEEYQDVKLSVDRKGLRLPVVVRSNDGLEIIDGEQRWRACKDLGFKEILIYDEGIITDKEAQELTIWYQQQVPFDELKLAQMLVDMENQYQVIDTPYTKEDLDLYRAMLEFDPQKYNQAGSGPNETETETMIFILTNSEKEIIEKALAKAQKQWMSKNSGAALASICDNYISNAE